MYGQPFGAPTYTHSVVTNEAADESPTVALVRYLVDTAHESLSPDILAARSTRKVLLNARNWLKVADEDLIEDDFDGEVNPPILELAAPIIADLSTLIPGVLSLHSLVINWSDHDTEQGTFGTTVRAWDHTHAEYIARVDMERSEDAGSDFTGSVVDHNIGASWMADELEKALRALAEWARANATGDLPEPLLAADKVLARVDAAA